MTLPKNGNLTTLQMLIEHYSWLGVCFSGRGTGARGTSAAVVNNLQIRDVTQELKHSMSYTVQHPTKLEKQPDQENTFRFWPTNQTPPNFAGLFVKTFQIHNVNEKNCWKCSVWQILDNTQQYLAQFWIPRTLECTASMNTSSDLPKLLTKSFNKWLRTVAFFLKVCHSA